MNNELTLSFLLCVAFVITPTLLAGGDEIHFSAAADQPAEEKTAAAQLETGDVPEGMRLVSVRAATSGELRRGDHVDVYVTLVSRDSKGKETVKTRHLLVNVEVFVLGNDDKEDEPSKRVNSVSLLVTPKQAGILQVGREKGVFSLAVRAEEE